MTGISTDTTEPTLVLSGSFPVPASLLIGLDVANLVANPTGETNGPTLHDVMGDARDARAALQHMQHIPEVAAAVNALDIAIAVFDELTGMVPA